MIKENVPNRLMAVRREKLGIGQGKCANRLDLHFTTVCRHEKGRGLTASNMEMYANLYDVPIWELFFERDELV